MKYVKMSKDYGDEVYSPEEIAKTSIPRLMWQMLDSRSEVEEWFVGLATALIQVFETISGPIYIIFALYMKAKNLRNNARKHLAKKDWNRKMEAVKNSANVKPK